MSLPRYPEYKDSGVAWLGEVPATWRVRRLKHIATLNMGQSPSSEHYNVDGNGTPFLQGNADFGDVSPIPRSYCAVATKYASKGDILLSVRAPVGAINVADQAYGIGRGLCAITPHPTQNSAFMRHLVDIAKIELFSIATGSTYEAVTVDQVANVACFEPSASEQAAIAAFLDRETAKIDGLVAEQRRLIELLREKRQAVISHAVTKGLNPDAPMKPSGIEWLGDVPQHWAVAKMKWVARMESGHTPDKKIAAYWKNCEIPWVSLNDTGFLKDNDYISDTAYRVNELGIANSSARLLPARVVVFSRDATIGRCAITTRPMAVSQHFIAWVCGDLMVPEFLLLRLRSMTQELDRLTTGATLKTIGMPDVRTLITPVPPVDEQKAIVEHVAEERGRLNGLLAEAERAIALLQERRTALISAAVTGKIDVRGGLWRD